MPRGRRATCGLGVAEAASQTHVARRGVPRPTVAHMIDRHRFVSMPLRTSIAAGVYMYNDNAMNGLQGQGLPRRRHQRSNPMT